MNILLTSIVIASIPCTLATMMAETYRRRRQAEAVLAVLAVSAMLIMYGR